MSAKEQTIEILQEAISLAEISSRYDANPGMSIFGVLRYLTEHLNDLAVILEYPDQKEHIKWRQKEELEIGFRWAVIVNERNRNGIR